MNTEDRMDASLRSENQREYISVQTWNSYSTRVERAALRATGRSMTRVSISMHANSYIIGGQGDTLVVRAGWREAMRAANAEHMTPKPSRRGPRPRVEFDGET